MKIIAFFIAKMLLLAIPLNAAITFDIDPIAKTITFTGEDTGTPFEDMLSANAYWQTGNTTGAPEQLALTSAFSGDDIAYSGLVIYPSSLDGLFIEIAWISPSLKTFSGSATPISYSGLSLASQSILESTTSLTLQIGSGFSSFTAVPEPSAMIISMISAIGLLTLRGRYGR